MHALLVSTGVVAGHRVNARWVRWLAAAVAAALALATGLGVSLS
jgi:hypothetical protein